MSNNANAQIARPLSMRKDGVIQTRKRKAKASSTSIKATVCVHQHRDKTLQTSDTRSGKSTCMPRSLRITRKTLIR